MNFDKTELFNYTAEDLFLYFIDDKRNEEAEKRFLSYIDKYYNFDSNNDEITEEESEIKEQQQTKEKNFENTSRIILNILK